MSNIKEYKDIVAFHPGYYIAEVMESMEMNQVEFACRMGTTTKTLSCLLNGQANISNDLAKKLSVMLGTSTEVWLNLQNAYDQKLIEIQKVKDFEEQKAIVKEIDYKYFVDTVNLEATTNMKEKITNLCKWFKISDLRILLQTDFLVNYRSAITNMNDKNKINSKAWIQTAINCSEQIETEPYNAEKLRSFLPELREMTMDSPEEFLPRMKEIFAQCGVAFVLLPHLKNSGVNGAVKWINDKRVVLAMNNRGMDADKFWFSLFHEIKHVFQHKTKTVFLSYDEQKREGINIQLEEEANKFASDYLIPKKELDKLSPTKYISDKEIIAFASSINIDPGIVVGRLQHEGIIQANRGCKLKKKYVFSNDL